MVFILLHTPKLQLFPEESNIIFKVVMYSPRLEVAVQGLLQNMLS